VQVQIRVRTAEEVMVVEGEINGEW
jgi:hypothetical protein